MSCCIATSTHTDPRTMNDLREGGPDCPTAPRTIEWPRSQPSHATPRESRPVCYTLLCCNHSHRPAGRRTRQELASLLGRSCGARLCAGSWGLNATAGDHVA